MTQTQTRKFASHSCLQIRTAVFTIITLFLFSCARIPVQSVVLTDALQIEGERMHKLNLLLLNRVFLAKRDEIEKFIKEEYAPFIVQNMVGNLNETEFKAKLKEQLPDFTNAVTAVVNRRRDSLTTALELQREKIAEKLTTDYQAFDNAVGELKHLLESAAKVDKEKQALFDQAKALSSNRVDFNSVESALDRFIHSAGNVGNNAVELNNFLDRLLNNK